MTQKNTKIKDRRNKMRLIDADKLKQHYAWWNDENKELFDAIVDIQPTIEPEEAKRGKWLMCMKTCRLECDACGMLHDRI